jgi:hypothetical protein
MSATEVVAIVGAISTPLVAIAGYGFAEWRSRGDRDAARQLAEEAHGHERELARGARLYERRSPVYESLMRVVQPTMEHVEARNPIISFSTEPPLPPEPSLDDQREVQIQLRTHGSKEVGDAFQEWFQKVRLFMLHASTYEMIRSQGVGGDLAESAKQMHAARDEARDVADKLARLVSDELATF